MFATKNYISFMNWNGKSIWNKKKYEYFCYIRVYTIGVLCPSHWDQHIIRLSVNLCIQVDLQWTQVAYECQGISKKVGQSAPTVSVGLHTSEPSRSLPIVGNIDIYRKPMTIHEPFYQIRLKWHSKLNITYAFVTILRLKIWFYIWLIQMTLLHCVYILLIVDSLSEHVLPQTFDRVPNLWVRAGRVKSFAQYGVPFPKFLLSCELS